MADRLGAIRKLLTHERPDRRVAAATVLLELGADDDKTVGALAGALADEHPDVRRIAVEALGQLEAVEVVDRMAALLADPNAETRVAAEAAVLRLGDEAVPALSRLLDGPAPARRAGAGLLSRLQSTAGLGSLVESVDGSDGAVADRARKALHDRARGLPLTELRALRKRLEQRLGAARHDGEDGLAAALLPLLGEMPDATVVTRILAETGAEVPPAVRKAGLAAITAPLALSRGRRRDAAIEVLLGYLGEDDEDAVVRPVLRALADVPVPRALSDRLEALLVAPSAAARAYALGQLGQHGTPGSVPTLVDQLLTGAPPVREAARTALARLPEAASRLARALLETQDAERRREIGELVRTHRAALRDSEVEALCAAVVAGAEADPERAQSLVEAACAALPEPVLAAVRARAGEHREARRLADAGALLAALVRCPAFGDEERYLLAVLGLERAAEAQSRQLRPNDRTCQAFADLIRSGFPLEARLAEEGALEVRDLYGLGFALAESRDEEERDVGRELLEDVTRMDPEGKLGLAARNKLRLTGAGRP